MLKENNKRVLVVGDIHMKESLGYAEYLPGRRKKEEQEVLDFIVSESKDCDTIVIVGDALNSKNNTSEVIKRFVSFLKRFDGKQVYLMSGNHDAFADGRTAIDFLKKVDNPSWKVITDCVYSTNTSELEMTFCPYLYKEELGVNGPKEATEIIYERIKPTQGNRKILFAHHAIAGSKTTSGTTADLFDEPVLDRQKLEGMFDLIVGGHIHKPQVLSQKAFVTGSVYNNEVGETQKYIWKINEDLSYEQIALPGRKIYKIENPSEKDLEMLPSGGIVKIILTDTQFKLNGTEELKKILKKKFDAYLLVEQYPRERRKHHFDEGGAFDFSAEKLLEIYAKERDVDIDKLKRAFSLVNEKYEQR